jgi:HK97 family phage major capsid protein
MPPQARKSWYSIQNEKGRPVSIVIEDEIGGWGVSAKQFRSDFGRIGKNEAINVHIKSGGGSIFEGNEIANIIREHKGEVNVSLGSICASIATVVMCAGAKVTAAKNSLIMIHNPEVYAGGDSEELRKMADIMDKMKGGIVDAYIAKTGKSATELSEAMDEETWFTAEEAMDFGFVNEISNEDADDAVVDSVDLSHYKNLSKLVEGEFAKGILATITGNGKRPTLAEIRNSVQKTAPTPPNPPTVPPKTMDKTTEQIAAENQAEIERLATTKAGEIVKAQNLRAKEIRDVVAVVKKRDSKDFSPLAEEYLNDASKSLEQFFRDIASSDKFKPTEVVGSGIQLVEPLDAYRGTIGHAFVTSAEFRALSESIKRRNGNCHIDGLRVEAHLPDIRNVQTSLATSGSGLTSIEKWPEVIQLGVRPLTIEDLVTGGQTNNTTFRFIQEVTYTEAATSVARTGADETTTPLPAVAVTYTEIDAPVVDIGGYIKASENVLGDYPGIASLINMRLPYQVDRNVEDEMMNGAGAGTDMTGILQTAGVQTLAVGAVPKADVTLKLQTLIRWQAMGATAAQGGFEPDAYVIHPTDWETLVLIKDSNGQYLCRGPFTGSYGTPAQQGEVGSIVEFYTLWGKKVVISPVVAQGTVVCGAWKQGAMKLDRQGLIIEMTNSDASDFLSRKITIRGTRRLALAVIRPANFATGTGF